MASDSPPSSTGEGPPGAGPGAPSPRVGAEPGLGGGGPGDARTMRGLVIDGGPPRLAEDLPRPGPLAGLRGAEQSLWKL